MNILRIDEGEQIAEFFADSFNKLRVDKVKAESVEMIKCPKQEKNSNACLFFMLQFILSIINQHEQFFVNPHSIILSKPDAETMRYRVGNFIYDQIPSDINIERKGNQSFVLDLPWTDKQEDKIDETPHDSLQIVQPAPWIDKQEDKTDETSHDSLQIVKPSPASPIAYKTRSRTKK